MSDQLFPQTDAIHLDEKGMTIKMHVALEIYKSMMSNPNLSFRIGTSSDRKDTHPFNDHFLMDQAFQLADRFISNFEEK